MSMKKLGSILLSTAMVMSLAACGSQNTSAPAATTDDSATKEEAAAPAESAVAADTDVSGSTLEVAVTYTGDQATTFQGLRPERRAEADLRRYDGGVPAAVQGYDKLI